MSKRSIEVFASAARTATPDAVEINCEGAEYLYLFIDCTADPAAASVVVDIDYYDPLTGKSSTLLASAAVAAVGTQLLRIGVGLPATANVSANCPVPEQVKITATHADTDSITYQVTAQLIG